MFPVAPVGDFNQAWPMRGYRPQIWSGLTAPAARNEDTSSPRVTAVYWSEGGGMMMPREPWRKSLSSTRRLAARRAIDCVVTLGSLYTDVRVMAW